MVYKIRRAWLKNDASVVEGKRAQTFCTPQRLNVGGLYFLRKERLYRVIEDVSHLYPIE